jgi:lipopolysaccharide/colanic/teichoic acid biosynthesis glycosyltransferase
MSKLQIRPIQNQEKRTMWQMNWKAIAYVPISAILVILTTLYLRKISYNGSWLDILGLLLLSALLTFVFERMAAAQSMHYKWRYRLAFLGSAGLSLGAWLVLRLLPSQSLELYWVFFVLLGAFLGGLLATGINEGFWEDNSPPLDRVKDEVHQLHLDFFGRPDPSPFSKRIFDLSLACAGLILSTPVWLLSSFLVWIEDPGPLLFVKNSVGVGGINFHQFKFRTMVKGAEEHTGPIMAREADERVLFIGSFLRKTALDELPQLINILRGEMSFVGPRPQRTVLVRGYLDRMPEYAERHMVLPGLAGLAQVAGDYYLTPRQKLRFDRIYIHHISLGFDIKLILLAFLITGWYRWQSDWDGRLPRRLFRFGSEVKYPDPFNKMHSD